jgi:tubulin-folding cofactor B
MPDDEALLGSYGPQDYWYLHIIDSSGGASAQASQYEDTSRVDKFVLSEDEYNKRDNTFRKYMAKMRAQDPDFCKKWGFKEPPKVIDADLFKEEADAIKIDDRC